MVRSGWPVMAFPGVARPVVARCGSSNEKREEVPKHLLSPHLLSLVFIGVHDSLISQP